MWVFISELFEIKRWKETPLLLMSDETPGCIYLVPNEAPSLGRVLMKEGKFICSLQNNSYTRKLKVIYKDIWKA